MLEGTIRRTEERKHAQSNSTAPLPGNDLSPCSEITLQLFESRRHVADRTWNDLATNAEGIFEGTIVGAREGFLDGIAATIYELRVERHTRIAPGYPTGATLYFGYPAADFSIGGHRFCNAGPRQFYVPAIGDHALVFAFDPPIDADGLFLPTKEKYLFFQHDGKIIPPNELSTDSSLPTPLSFHALERDAERRQSRAPREVGR